MSSTRGSGSPFLAVRVSLSLPISWCSRTASRNPQVGVALIGVQTTSVPAGLMIASHPEASCWPGVLASQYVDPGGSTTNDPNRPWSTRARFPGPGWM